MGCVVAIAVREKVEPILDVFAARLRSVLDRAMKDWVATPGRAKFIYNRTSANVIFDHIIRHALAEFDGDGDATVKALREPQSVKFLFHSTILARFKRGNARGIGSNIETQAVLDFVDPQGSFAGLPELHRVEIVYQLDILGTGLAEVSIVARNKWKRIWSYPLNGRPAATVIHLPTPPRPVLLPPKVTPKPVADDKAEDNKSAE